MKMKKLTTFVACAAMAGVFATSAFAANDAQVARAQDYLNSKGIAYTCLLYTSLFDLSGLTASDPSVQFMGTLNEEISNAQQTNNIDGSATTDVYDTATPVS